MPDITPFSLRARLAMALGLFAGYCQRRGLDHPHVAEYVNYLWRFVGLDGSGKDFGDWSDSEPPLIWTGLGDEYPTEFELILAARQVPEPEFRRAICVTTEVLYGSLFGACDELGSRRYLTELALLVEPLGIPFPDTTLFATSQWHDGHGWGQLVDSEQLAIWRATLGA